MNTEHYIEIGDASKELKSIQIISLALNSAAQKVTQMGLYPLLDITLPPVLKAASKAISLASINGLSTPIEILALSTRNTFELYTRLITDSISSLSFVMLRLY